MRCRGLVERDLSSTAQPPHAKTPPNEVRMSSNLEAPDCESTTKDRVTWGQEGVFRDVIPLLQVT